MRIELILLILLSFLSSCNSSGGENKKWDTVDAKVIKLNKTDNPPIKMKKIGECRIDFPSKGWPIWLKGENADNLIVLSIGGSYNNLSVFDESLQFINSYRIKVGKGPGEAVQPSFIMNKGQIIMIDSMEKRITIFDSNFVVIRCLKFEKPEFGFGYMLARGLVTNNNISSFLVGFSGSGEGAKGYERTLWFGKINYDTGEYFDIRSYIPGNHSYTEASAHLGAHWMLHNKSIYFLDQIDYSIAKMDLNGNVIKKIRVDLPEKTFTKEQIREWQKNYGYSKILVKTMGFPKKLYHAVFIIPIGKGFAVGKREDYSPEEREWMEADYFDMDMNHKGKIRLPAYDKWNEPVFDGRKADHLFYNRPPYFYYLDVRDEASYIVKWEIKNNA